MPTTTIAQSAPASMREEPFRRHPDISISLFLSLTTISSQGRAARLEAEERPAMIIWLSFSIGTGSPVKILILRLFKKVSSICSFICFFLHYS